MEKIKLDAITNTIKNIIITEVGASQHTVSPDLIQQSIDKVIELFGYSIDVDDLEHIRFRLETTFNVNLSSDSIILSNPNVQRWLQKNKNEIHWNYWEAYKQHLIDEDRSVSVIDENEKVIDSILDLSGDPRIDGAWSRKGLVMGNVQSGKTQNYIGLINKSIDAGYKVIILLGGHMNALRNQTQERVDYGVIGRESSHIITNSGVQEYVGVGKIRDPSFKVATVTSTKNDFNAQIANGLGIDFKDLASPIILTIKKNTKILDNLNRWIRERHMLDVEKNIKLDMPMMLIDDEADYASINSQHHRNKITKTNQSIRELLSYFHKNTYVAYTATPFANIFIDPDTQDEMFGDDLFPEDFMIKVPVPDVYMGQDYYFGDDRDEEEIGPVIQISDNEDLLPMAGQKKDMPVGNMPESLKEAVEAFILSCAVRDSRGDTKKHKTMMVNITHLNLLQAQIAQKIEDYLSDLRNAINNIGLGVDEALKNKKIAKLNQTFINTFSIKESFTDIAKFLKNAVDAIEIISVHTGSGDLDYSSYRDNGRSVIVVGGHKLARGLTLEGLSVSYFARNAKAYDTLMQMCRWFGYRPKYGDLCKVYLPFESDEWYSFITEVINDLYRELDRMSLQNKTPRDFGLKVREHPGSLMPTAKTKIGFAESYQIKFDLWGSRQRRFRFKESLDTNNLNLKYAEEFINGLKQDPIINAKGIVYDDVPYEEVIKLIENLDILEDDLGNTALINHINLCRDNNLPKFKIAIYTIANQGAKNWMKDPRFLDIRVPKSYSIGGHNISLPIRSVELRNACYSSPRSELGGKTDESVFLDDKEINLISEIESDPINKDFITSPHRQFPALILYFFALTEIKPFGKLSTPHEITEINVPFGNLPVVGYSISFPDINNLKEIDKEEVKSKTENLAYLVNKKGTQLEMDFEIEDEE
jgi:hypothetical protein